MSLLLELSSPDAGTASATLCVRKQIPATNHRPPARESHAAVAAIVCLPHEKRETATTLRQSRFVNQARCMREAKKSTISLDCATVPDQRGKWRGRGIRVLTPPGPESQTYWRIRNREGPWRSNFRASSMRVPGADVRRDRISKSFANAARSWMKRRAGFGFGAHECVDGFSEALFRYGCGARFNYKMKSELNNDVTPLT